MRDLTANSQSWIVSNEKQKVQHNFSIDLAERFNNLIHKRIKPRRIVTTTEEAKINTKVTKLEGVTNSLLKRFIPYRNIWSLAHTCGTRAANSHAN